MKAIEKAKRCFDTNQQFADEMGVSRQVVEGWIKAGYIPLRHIIKVSEITGISELDFIKDATY